MSDPIQAAFSADVLSRAAEVVDFEAETGIVVAKLAAYEVEIQLYEDTTEVFTRGAFAGAVASPSRVKVTDQQHDRMVIGHAIELREEDDGLYGRLKIADTSHGRDTLTLLRDGVLDELSVEFIPQKKHMKVTREASMTRIRHNRATLVGISPVSRGAYGQNAKVLSVRAQAILEEDQAEREQAAAAAAQDLAARRQAELNYLRGLTA